MSLRILIVLPSWVGDAIMATPALRLVRSSAPGAFIGVLARPGIDEVLSGLDLFDEIHVERAAGVMGPKRVAAMLRTRRYDSALLLTNSFSTALTARLAFIPRRIGYARDGRSLLLTHRLTAPKRPDGRWAPTPAVTYYWNAALGLIDPDAPPIPSDRLPPDARLELACGPEQEHAAESLLARAGVTPGAPLALLNPGGNRASKRWPPDRYAAVADHLVNRGFTVLVNGSPAEAELVQEVASRAQSALVQLPRHAPTLGAIKAVIRRCRLMITNDTGPRHIAAAFRVPVITLFGPTDPRWTTIPAPGGEVTLVADPSLPPDEVADDHPDRCRIERIEVVEVLNAVGELLGGAGHGGAS